MDKYFLQKSGDLIYVAHYFKARRLSEGVSWRPHIYEQGIKKWIWKDRIETLLGYMIRDVVNA